MPAPNRTRAALLGWTLGIVVVSLVPSGGVSLWNLDKVGHFLAYAGLAVLICLNFQSRTSRLALFFAAVALGVSLELLQQFVPGRDMSLIDGSANAAGVLTGAISFRFLGDSIRRLAARFSLG